MQDHNEWLKFAFEDLQVAQKLADEEHPFIGSAMFHTQQCAEKSLKAFLVYKEEPLRRIHDLVALINLCKIFDEEFEAIRSDVVALNPYLCQTRYPDDCFMMPDVTALHAAVKQAHKIFYFVSDKISNKK